MPPFRTIAALLIAAVLGSASVACGDPKLPRFANPPPYDAGLDASADEDGGGN